MKEGYQMSDLEYNAFIEHCKATETYKETELCTYKSYPEGLFRAMGDGAMKSEDDYYSNAHNFNARGIETNYFKNGRYYELIKTKKVKVKGYNKNAPYINSKGQINEK